MSLLTLFLKARPAASAGDGDLARAAGDAEGLLAVGAGEVAVILVLGLGALQLEPAVHGGGQLQELGVLGTTAVDLAAHHTNDGDEDAHQTQRGDQLHPGHDGQQPEYKVQNQQEIIQFIAAVTAVHQFL